MLRGEKQAANVRGARRESKPQQPTPPEVLRPGGDPGDCPNAMGSRRWGDAQGIAVPPAASERVDG
jgi:hypothetical protein